MPFPKDVSIPNSPIRFLRKKAKKGMDIQIPEKSEEYRKWRTPTKTQVEQLMNKMNWGKGTVN